eukprot:1147431-Pelagomonas_calceolata.AAC.1
MAPCRGRHQCLELYVPESMLPPHYARTQLELGGSSRCQLQSAPFLRVLQLVARSEVLIQDCTSGHERRGKDYIAVPPYEGSLAEAKRCL